MEAVNLDECLTNWAMLTNVRLLTDQSRAPQLLATVT